MIPADALAARRAALGELLAESDVDAMLVTSGPNVAYLTGFTGTNGQVLVAAAGQAVLVTDARYGDRAASEAPGVEIVLDRDWVGRAIAFAGEHGPGLAFESTALSYGEACHLLAELQAAGRWGTGLGGMVEQLRVVKDEHELVLLGRACELTVAAFDAVLESIAGSTERDIARRLDRTMEDLGADAPAFAPIVATGPNSAVPHHAPTDRRVSAGDLVTLDFGAQLGGYHADMTRMVAVGEPAPDLLAVHEHVLAAQAAGVAAALAGTAAGEVDAACRSLLEHAGLGDAFVHGTGHGVGLQIHEAPAVARDSSAILRAGSTITIEPGAYLPGHGGVRIEDTVVVRPEGPPDRLTAAPRDLVRL